MNTDKEKQVQKEKEFEPKVNEDELWRKAFDSESNVHSINKASVVTPHSSSGNSIEQGWYSYKDMDECFMVGIEAFIKSEDKGCFLAGSSDFEEYMKTKYLNSDQNVQECDANTLDHGSEPMANNNSFTEEDLLELIRYCAEMENDGLGLYTEKQILTNFLNQQKGA